MSNIVVIGANHAGTAAVNTILNLNPEANVAVLDADSHISFLGCGMALWIGGQIDGPEGLFYSSQKMLEDHGAEVHMETAVTHIDFEEKLVHAVDGDGAALPVAYDKLILATGSRPVIPPLEGVTLRNVQQVKRYQDAEEVIRKLQTENIRSVAVVGAGYIGVELAEAFRRDGKEVTLIDAADTCLASYYDSTFTKRMAQRLQEHGVRLAFQQSLLRLEGETCVERVVTTKGSYPCDMAVLALGFTPNTELGRGILSTYKNGAFLVDRRQQTNLPDVYAIGDCAVVYDNAIDELNYIALASNAVRSGIVAAHNVCGQPLFSPGVQGSNGISIWGLNMVSTGLTLGKALARGIHAAAADFTDNQRPRFMHPNAPVTIRIVYDKESRVILGAQLMSEYDISMGIHLFSLAVQEKLTMDKLKLLDLFFLPHFNQPYNYITMAALGAE